MARRSDHSREEIHEMALSAAEQIVREQGYGGLSARKVAGAIGYTVGTLYLVFDNLDDLILQVNSRTLDRLHAQMLQEQSAHAPARERLLQLGHSYIRFANEDPHRWGMIFEHRFPPEQETPAWFRVKVERMFALVEARLEPLAGEHSANEIAQAARALWSGVHGICILAITDRLDIAGVSSVQQLTQFLMDNFLDGFISGCN
ncbi:MAG: TetR/AcrR family transcriptional regulator [Gammaproteobacteria bacterium]|nr:TetR/AcrR family transcriptional regulator [Gammaproteobacteria bacterium]